MTVTAIVPAIPIRGEWLARALASIATQERMPDEVCVRVAHDRMWLGHQRDHLARQATGEWLATLDDDDEWYPHHLRLLEEAAAATGADMVFSWFDVEGGTDPFPDCAERPWSNSEPFPTTSVVLVKRELALDVGGWGAPYDPTLLLPHEETATPAGGDPGPDPDGNRAGEDVFFVRRLMKAGAHIVHLPLRTWRWHHHGAEAPHTMGLPSRWSSTEGARND